MARSSQFGEPMPIKFKTAGFLQRLIAISILLALPLSSARAADSCRDMFAFSEIRNAQTEIRNAQVASDFFMSEMKKQSDAIKKANAGKTIEVDFICLGAGPQCASASLVLGRSKIRALVLEKSAFVAKTFAEKDFVINSSELESLTMHAFPGGVGSLADYTSQKYAYSTQLAAYIQGQQYASNVPVLLGTKMISARVLSEKGQVLIEISTDQGITIRTKHLSLGLGLGEVGTKVADANYKSAFESALRQHLDRPDTLLPIMSTDAVLVAIKNADKKKLYFPQRIVIIGNGDGSRIVIEALASPNVVLPEGFHMTWVGNTFKTADQYIESQGGWDRYIQKIVPFYERGQVSGIPGHIETWEVRENGKMRITTTDKTTQSRHEAEGDMIIDSTGYDTNLPGILAGLGAHPDLVDVKGPLPASGLQSTILARQAVKDGQPIPVYAIGPAAGRLATKEELADAPNMNTVAIFNTVPRTSMFTSQLLGLPPFAGDDGKRESRPVVRKAEELIQEAQKKRQQQTNGSISVSDTSALPAA